VRLAALYREDAGDACLHVAVDGGFAPVDELAAGARRPDLAGLRDVGDLYARGADAVEQLRELAEGALCAGEGKRLQTLPGQSDEHHLRGDEVFP